MLLLALVPHVAQLAQQTCALADPPFRVRAVRKREGIWTADVFLRSTWLPGANVSLRWSSVAPPTASTRGLVHHANHANITKRYTDGVDFTLHETGPADGTPRVMVHLHGVTPTVPRAVTCTVPAASPRPVNVKKTTTSRAEPPSSDSGASVEAADCKAFCTKLGDRARHWCKCRACAGAPQSLRLPKGARCPPQRVAPPSSA